MKEEKDRKDGKVERACYFTLAEIYTSRFGQLARDIQRLFVISEQSR